MCGCLNGSKNLNLHLEIAFFLKTQSIQKFQNILSPSPNHCGPLRDTKTSNFFYRVFNNATLKSYFRPCYKMSNFYPLLLQSNLHKTTIFGTTQKWPSWKGGCLIKNLYQVTTNQIWLFLSGFSWVFFSSECFERNKGLLE